MTDVDALADVLGARVVYDGRPLTACARCGTQVEPAAISLARGWRTVCASCAVTGRTTKPTPTDKEKRP